MSPTRSTCGAICRSNSSHLPPHRRLEIGKPRDVAGRPGQVRDEATADRIGDRDEHQRYVANFRLKDRGDQVGIGHHQIWSQAEQLYRHCSDALGIIGAITKVDPKVISFDPTELLKLQSERRDL
jgi:hypothetical protein